MKIITINNNVNAKLYIYLQLIKALNIYIENFHIYKFSNIF